MGSGVLLLGLLETSGNSSATGLARTGLARLEVKPKADGGLGGIAPKGTAKPEDAGLAGDCLIAGLT